MVCFAEAHLCHYLVLVKYRALGVSLRKLACLTVLVVVMVADKQDYCRSSGTNIRRFFFNMEHRH